MRIFVVPRKTPTLRYKSSDITYNEMYKIIFLLKAESVALKCDTLAWLQLQHSVSVGYPTWI